uniref:Odorant receptor n=1 Tax=Yemma signatus TaxID=300820 RepID=A0A385H546_9HEMI|nr:odorant receptor [Yemma signatus]
MDFSGSVRESDLVEGLDISLFKLSGIWGILNHYRDHRERSWTLYSFIALSFVSLFSFVLFQVYNIFFISFDVRVVSLLILNPLTTIQSLTKLAVLFISIEKQAALLNLFRRDFLPSITREKQERASDIYRYLSKQSNYFCFLATFANTLCVMFWNVLPIIRSDAVENLLNVKLKADGEPNKILGGWYPIPYGESPWYEAVYVYEFIACCWCGFIISFYEILLISLVMMLGTHIRVLGFHIARLTEDTRANPHGWVDLGGREASPVGDPGISSYQLLLLYIKDHQMLMKVGDEFRKMYNHLITMQLGLGLLIMTISVFHFIFVEKNFFMTFKFLVYLTYQVTEIVLYCYCGTFLETASSDVVFAIYNTDWYRLDKKFRCSSQMLMIRAQTPLSLIAVRLYPVNSVTLLSMMQFTYSMAAFLCRLTN